MGIFFLWICPRLISIFISDTGELFWTYIKWDYKYGLCVYVMALHKQIWLRLLDSLFLILATLNVEEKRLVWDRCCGLLMRSMSI